MANNSDTVTIGNEDHNSTPGDKDRKGNHSHQAHHAHFVVPNEQDDLKAHDSTIIVEPVGEDTLNIRLGFLQIHHVYEVRFSIPDKLGEDVVYDPLQNLHAKIEAVTPTDDGKGHEIVLMFKASKEKIMQESVKIASKGDESKVLTLILHARVLGKGKGTPSLKNGIHCVKIEWDEESDASDWQGF